MTGPMTCLDFKDLHIDFFDEWCSGKLLYRFSLSKQISRDLQILCQFRTWLEHHQLRFRIKWIRSKPNSSKALKTSEKILAPVVVSFIHCSDRSSSVSFSSLPIPFINIANCAAFFTSVLSSIAKLHDTKFFTLSLGVSQTSPASSSMRLAIVQRDYLIFSNSCTILAQFFCNFSEALFHKITFRIQLHSLSYSLRN